MLPESYNTLIIEEWTDLSMITQHINNTYILTANAQYIQNNSTNARHKTYKHTYIFFISLQLLL